MKLKSNIAEALGPDAEMALAALLRLDALPLDANARFPVRQLQWALLEKADPAGLEEP